MNPLTEIFRSSFAAVAYAEAGEHETAMAMAGVQPRKSPSASPMLNAFQRVFVAASFAEEGLHAEAVSYLESRPAPRDLDTDYFLDSVGLQGIRVQFVLARL